MAPTISIGGRGLSFRLGTTESSAARPRSEDAPLRILVAADCSGRAARGVCEPLSGRRARDIDVDRLDEVFATWGALISTPLRLASGAPLLLAPRTIEDLHPDELLRSAAPLARLLALRDALGTDPDAARRLTALSSTAPSAGTATGDVSVTPVASDVSTTPAASSTSESSGETLSRVLGRAPGAAVDERAPHPAARAAVDIGGFIRSIVGSSATRDPNAVGDATALTSAANVELCALLRALVSDPGFRSLEATWRGVDGLCRNCPDEALVRHSVVDASPAELMADPRGVSALLEASPISILLVDHYFGPSAEDLEALTRLLLACKAHGVVLVTGAHPHLAGCADFAEVPNPEDREVSLSEGARKAWEEAQRARADGAHLALVVPRFLLRQPYGRSGEPIEHLAFEELVEPRDHDAFSWGNGAYLLARALAVVHAGSGGSVHPDGSVDLRELPVVHLEAEEGVRVKPCAESWLSERAVGRLRAGGFSVLQGIRDTDRVRVHL
jgi:hypothetical protein